jgi:hypothetical protein
MAHGFKTGGRKRGSLNKVTSEMKAAIAASDDGSTSNGQPVPRLGNP